MSDQAIEKAKKAVKEILETLGIERVVSVDDGFKDTPDIEEVLTHAATLSAKALRRIMPALGKVSLQDKDIKAAKIREAWDGMDEAERTAASDQILVGAHREKYAGEENDREVAAILHQLIPAGRLDQLSPAQWNRRRIELLAETTAKPTLFLFDNDLGAANGGADSGMRIVSSLLSGNSSIICGLLTRTVSGENQIERWKELSGTFQADQDRFVPIPKQFLYESPGIFAQMLKLVALAPQYNLLKKEAKDILKSAQAVAEQKVEDILIHDLDHMVFKVSNEEGAWEPEMLFRLHGLFHRLEARKLAHDGGKLEQTVDRLRSVSGIATDEFVPSTSAQVIAQLERFESGEYVNASHLPLDLGDIFECPADGTRYILVAPICDLMVRPRGKRQPEVPRLTLLTLSKVVSDGTSGAKRTNRDAPSDYELDHVGTDANEQWLAKFKWPHYVNSSILDLCVFNADGTAGITMDMTAPPGLRPAWSKRYVLLSTKMKSLCKKLEPFETVAGEEAVAAAIRSQGREALLGQLLDEGLFRGTMVTDEMGTRLAYGIRRIDRLSRARAIGLLAAYTAFLGRPAYDVDFDK